MNDLAAITCFFSYSENPYVIKRYREFQENLERQGVKLYTIELAFFDNGYLLNPGDENWKRNCLSLLETSHGFSPRFPIYLRLRTDTVLWHKETLLNILVKKLPPHIKRLLG